MFLTGTPVSRSSVNNGKRKCRGLNTQYNLDCFLDSELDSESDKGEEYKYEHNYETLL